MTDAPPYFEDVRARCQALGSTSTDPVLAGPGTNCSSRQSPRHVVSELLQNVTMRRNHGFGGHPRWEFIFIHNGEDFIEEHFIPLPVRVF